MAFPIVEIDGAVIGGFIAGIIGFGIAYYTHRSAVNDAKEAARKAKKDALRICLIEVKYIQKELDLLICVEAAKLPTSTIHFTRTIYSANVVHILGELPCRELIHEYYTSLEYAEIDKYNLRQSDPAVVPVKKVPEVRALYNYLNFTYGMGMKLEECLKKELIAEG